MILLGLLLGMALSAWYDHQAGAFIALLASLAVYLLGIVALLIYRHGEYPAKNEDRPLQGSAAQQPISQSAVDDFRTQQLTRFAREHKLTGRETDVCARLTRGHTVKAIAEDLCISENTVWTHIRSVYSKCEVTTKQDLIKLFDEQE